MFSQRSSKEGVLKKTHNSLLNRYDSYRSWHQKSYSSKVHYLIITLTILASILFGYYFTFYSAENYPTNAGVVAGEVSNVYPADGNILITKRPTLKWTTLSWANGYKIRFYQDDALLREKIVTTNSYTPDFELADKGNYYWTVQGLNLQTATNDNNTVYAASENSQKLAAKRFWQPSSTPPVPSLISPINGYVSQVDDVFVDWATVTDRYSPVRYIAEYSTNPATNADGSFTYPNYKSTYLTASSTIFMNLSTKKYYWHTCSINNIGTKSNWTPVRSFDVNLTTTTTTTTNSTRTPAPIPTTPEPTTNSIINSESVFSPFWNFSVDTARSSEFQMPDPTKRMIGAYVPGENYDSSESQNVFPQFEALTGKEHDISNRFFSFYYNVNFPEAVAKGIYNQGRHFLLTWEPWKAGSSSDPTWSQFANSDIINNQVLPHQSSSENYDTYIDRWAKQIKAYKKPVYIRFAHEMNGTGAWYPWMVGTNGNTQSTYGTMWRHVHGIFDRNGVKNVRWVWCANNDPSSNISGFYPGDAYVDIIAFDGYNWGNTRSWSGWRDLSSLFGAPYSSLATKSKPIWITETASTEAGGNKATWITSSYNYAKSNWPKVKAIIWFNQIKENDWRVNSSAASLEAYKAAIQSFKY